MSTLKVSSPDSRKALADLRAARAQMHRNLPRAVRRSAEAAAEAVRRKASWSSRIPDAVEVHGAGAAATVTVDPAKAPEAAALNNGGRGGAFEHPVYGQQDVTVSQKARPFFDAGIAEKRKAIDKPAEQLLDDMTKRAGFR